MTYEAKAGTKRWVRATWDGIGQFVACPFCQNYQALNKTMPWCSTCGCEYRVTRNGAVFDQSLKTQRYAWGKALNLAGGIKIGNWS